MTAAPYVIVLAGGDGNRLSSLTRALYGVDLAKQFAVLADDRSLLQATIERAAALTSLGRISVIVTSHHEPVARVQLAPYPGVELVVQPCNLDTAAGVLLPLVRVLARAPDARVVFLPSDHHVKDPGPIRAALATAATLDRVTLIGVRPTSPETEYGWITCGESIGGAFEVGRFVEKPPRSIAEVLLMTGGLWNTFIQSAPACMLWELARSWVPAHTTTLERYATSIGRLDEAEALAAAYRAMHPASFSREVLSNARELAVIPVAGSGWSDWGTPQRVFASLAGTPSHDRLVARIGHDMAFAVG